MAIRFCAHADCSFIPDILLRTWTGRSSPPFGQWRPKSASARWKVIIGPGFCEVRIKYGVLARKREE